LAALRRGETVAEKERRQHDICLLDDLVTVETSR
jgi:hypothetical protein